LIILIPNLQIKIVLGNGQLLLQFYKKQLLSKMYFSNQAFVEKFGNPKRRVEVALKKIKVGYC
jgi:hypothetical protein